MLGELAGLDLGQDRLEEAGGLLAQGDVVLRAIGNRLDLGKLLCVRAELERRSGDLVAARAALDEAEALAVDAKGGVDSDLGRKIAKAREALAAPP